MIRLSARRSAAKVLPLLAGIVVLLCSCSTRHANVREEMDDLRSADPAKRHMAAGSLALLGHEAGPAVPLLLEQLEREDNKSTRSAIVRALGKSGDERAVGPLKQSKEAWALSEIAVDGRDRKAEKLALQALLETVRGQNQSMRERIMQVFDAQKSTHGEETKKYLHIAVEDPSPGIRLWAIRSIPKLMGREGMPLLRGRLADTSEHLRIRAAVALAKFGDDTVLDALEEGMFDRDNEDSSPSPSQCMLVLKSLDGPRVIELLKRWVVAEKRDWPAAIQLLRRKGAVLPKERNPHKVREFLVKEAAGKKGGGA